jgi:hypothetical protein
VDARTPDTRRFSAAVALTLVLTMGFETGCSERRLLRREDLASDAKFREFYVTTRDGRERTYIYVSSDHDSLTGTVQEKAELVVATGGGGESRQTVTRIRKERLAWSDVTRIEANRTGKGRYLLGGLGALALGVGAVLILSGGGEEGGSGNGGKPPPPPPGTGPLP